MASTAGSPRPYPTPEEWREKGCCGCTFRDLSCGYRGRENWCDHGTVRCTELGNIERFDGALPDIVEPMQIYVPDVIATLLCIACYWWAWPWNLAVPIYTASCSFFIPQVRHEVILWWTLHVQPLRRYLVRRDKTQYPDPDD